MARRLRARYLVGIDARTQVVLTWLRNWLVARAMPQFGDLVADEVSRQAAERTV